MSARITEWRRRALLVLGAMIAAVILFEAAVKIAGVDYNLSHNWKFHPVLGWSQIPNGRYWYQNPIGLVTIEFNSSGFRDVEHAKTKKPGVKRIVLIGDSFCEAVQVNLYDTFFRRLQDKLGDGWEIINLGVGDFGSANEWLALTRIGLDYSPDVVIQEIFPLNDVCNNSVELYDVCGSGNDQYRPYFVESGGELTLTSAQPVRNFLRRHLASYGVLERALTSKRTDDPYKRWLRFTSQGMTVQPTLGSFASDATQHPAVARAWALTEKILEKTAALCKEKNIVYLPVVFPFEAELGDWQGVTEPFPRVDLVVDYPEVRLGRLFSRLGVPSVMLRDALLPHADEVLPYVDGHLNVAGHRVSADAIYAKLVALGLVK
ncbi:MAG TPA: SGNH/GDSL hydrolase family protein [Polyangia bacterium]|nr:SGNH/GDSL hydrolase family protein [Polyangia bacterium]